MSVLVDTSVWSLVLRRKKRSPKAANIMKQIVRDGMVKIIGPIRQEILSGIPDKKQFDRLKKHLSYFPDISLRSTDFERGAEFFNQCRIRGIQGSHTDFLICAVAYAHSLRIFTTDKDFLLFQQILPIELFEYSG